MDRYEQWHGPAEPAAVRAMRDHAQEFARGWGMTGDGLADVRACVSEAVTNSVVHAFRDGRPPGTVTVSAERRDDQIVVSVVDDGIGFAPRTDSPGIGFGMPMIATMASSMTVNPAPAGGTELAMAFALMSAQPPARALL